MEKRKRDLLELHSYITNVDNEVSLALQSLQWDKNNLLQCTETVLCAHNPAHRIPVSNQQYHQRHCSLKSLGYSDEDVMLPDPPYPASKACVSLCKEKIGEIIKNAAELDPLFKKVYWIMFSCTIMQGLSHVDPEPLTLARLQTSYSSDERRALYDAVVATAPMVVQDVDFILPSDPTKGEGEQQKSRLEVIAELRDMKRRRTKYRVTRTKNYSQVLNDVIHHQMELYVSSQPQIEDKIDTTDKHKDQRDLDKTQASRKKAHDEKLNKGNNYNKSDKYRTQTHDIRRDTDYRNDRTYKRNKYPTHSQNRSSFKEKDDKEFKDFRHDRNKRDRDNKINRTFKEEKRIDEQKRACEERGRSEESRRYEAKRVRDGGACSSESDYRYDKEEDKYKRKHDNDHDRNHRHEKYKRY